MRINQSGRSMIEMLGVLAIIGVLSVGGIAGYSKAMGKYKTNQVVDQVSMIVTNIRTLYAQQMDYTGLNTVTAVNMGVIPEELVNKNASSTGTGVYTSVTLRNGFQGNVNIYATKSRETEPDTTKTAFMVVFEGLSRDACVAIATSDWGSGSASGFIGMTASSEAFGTATDDSGLVIGCNGTNLTDKKVKACPNGSTTSVPMPVAKAAQACSCRSGNACSIAWKYY